MICDVRGCKWLPLFSSMESKMPGGQWDQHRHRLWQVQDSFPLKQMAAALNPHPSRLCVANACSTQRELQACLGWRVSTSGIGTGVALGQLPELHCGY